MGLSFNGVPERLYIPFPAVSAFIDPYASFGLRFDAQVEAEKDPAALPAAEAPAAPSPASPPEPAPPQAATDAAGAEVVSLDAFRKKGG